MKKITLLVGCFAVLLLIQLVPVHKTNPPVTSEIVVDAPVREIFKRSCYDCHSNETIWPWYSYVAPVSWLVVGHVNEGRGKLNFSTWDQYDASKRRQKLAEIEEEIKNKSMPLSSYLLLHRQAGLSASDLSLITGWLMRP